MPLRRLPTENERPRILYDRRDGQNRAAHVLETTQALRILGPPPLRSDGSIPHANSEPMLQSAVSESRVAVKRRAARTVIGAIIVTVVVLALAACAATTTSAVPAPVDQLQSSHSIAPRAKPLCPNLGQRAPILAAGSSTVGQLRAMTLTPTYKARLGLLKGPATTDSSYAAICVYSTQYQKAFPKQSQYVAWWVVADGRDGILAVW